MGLKKLLEERVSQYQENSQEKKVAEWLNAKASEIINDASEHLKYVSHVFPEFDNHDALHSEGVLGIIESLLGDKAKELSLYDLFSLIAVSYLHDCGMAVSDREMKVLNMVEGKLDGQKLMSIKEAKVLIKSDLNHIYGNDEKGFNGEIKEWMFRPANEETFIKDLAELLIDYQSYRNGKIDKIKECKDEELTNLNNELRTEYLRITHHKRVEEYIINWGDTDRGLARFPKSGMGKLLANNLAKCCRAHGEDAEYMKDQFKRDEFKDETHVMYFGNEASNLQFVAMMLRLGDIIHFSYDRAHPVLRALHHFKSDYSYQQWHIKSSGLSFNVSNGKVSCSAFCQLPKDYYDLWTYVNCIDDELRLFNVLSSKWEEDFTKFEIDEKVDRKNIRHDASFTPAYGHKFSLDQNKVLELLMGAKLYTNEYACLRELYQNSLDACRCQIAMVKSTDNSVTPKGRIKFGLGDENGKKYVYCLDNGKGMTKDIIEKYLLHIGSSYYRSSDFFKKQAETGATFTPTSQFGIGMLSCFMIGDVIEITTREEGGEVVSCVMEGPNEYFYYKLPAREDAEKIHNSGTLVKVFLNNKYKELLNDDPLDKLGYLLWYNKKEPKESIKKDMLWWNNNLYQIINSSVLLVPDDINLLVSVQDLIGRRRYVKIYNKPLPIADELRDYAEWVIDSKDSVITSFNKLDNKELELYAHYNNRDPRIQFIRLKKSDYLDIRVEESGLECRMIFEFEKNYLFFHYSFLNGDGLCCVDGISVRDVDLRGTTLHHFKRLGVLNFIGENRPQLSVNREELINVSWVDYEQNARVLLKKLVDKSIAAVCDYLKNKGVNWDNPLYDEIWARLLNKFDFCIVLFYTCLKNNMACYDMIVPCSRNMISYGEFLISDQTIISKYLLYYFKADLFSSFLLLFRLLESSEIILNKENEIVMKGQKGIPTILSENEEFDFEYLLLCPKGYDDYWPEYDIVEYAGLNMVSDRLMKGLVDYLQNFKSRKIVIQLNWIYSDSVSFINKLIKAIEDHLLYRYKQNKETICFKIYESINLGIQEALVRRFVQENKYDCKISYLGIFLFMNDCSVLVFNDSVERISSCIVRFDRCTRQELLSSYEWRMDININGNVLFLDGTIWSSYPLYGWS